MIDCGYCKLKVLFFFPSNKLCLFLLDLFLNFFLSNLLLNRYSIQELEWMHFKLRQLAKQMQNKEQEELVELGQEGSFFFFFFGSLSVLSPFVLFKLCFSCSLFHSLFYFTDVIVSTLKLLLNLNSFRQQSPKSNEQISEMLFFFSLL